MLDILLIVFVNTNVWFKDINSYITVTKGKCIKGFKHATDEYHHAKVTFSTLAKHSVDTYIW